MAYLLHPYPDLGGDPCSGAACRGTILYVAVFAAVAFVTVGVKVLRVAAADPVDALRYA